MENINTMKVLVDLIINKFKKMVTNFLRNRVNIFHYLIDQIIFNFINDDKQKKLSKTRFH